MRWGATAAALCIGAGSAQADLVVAIADGNPWDTIRIVNTSACGPVSGVLELDLTTSAGNLLIDTMRGGPGTKDPMPVEVLEGPLQVAPIQDGAQSLSVTIRDLAPRTPAIIGLDFDDQQGWWPGPRVEVFGDEIAGTLATWQVLGQGTRSVFGTQGTVRLKLAADAPCTEPNRPDGPFGDTPSS